MRQKTVYVALDGSEHETEAECEYRDGEVQYELRVKGWLDELQAKPATRTRAFNALMEFYRYENAKPVED